MLDRISTPVAEYDLRKTHAALEPAAGSTTTRFLIAARETDDASRHLPSDVCRVSHRSFPPIASEKSDDILPAPFRLSGGSGWMMASAIAFWPLVDSRRCAI